MSMPVNLWTQMMNRRRYENAGPAAAASAASGGSTGPGGPVTGPVTVTVAIIGTAGRKEDGPKMNKSVFDGMVREARRVIHEEWALEPNRVRLVSGGAAWADHVAVTLWLQQAMDPDATSSYAGLQLYLPATFESKGKLSRVADTNSGDWRTNPGRTVNLYHAQFSQKLGRNTLYEIEQARAFGATLTVGTGFMVRNKQVAAGTDRVLAFTWGEGDVPKDGGTLHTWNACTRATVKLHLPLVRGLPPLVRGLPPSHTLQPDARASPATEETDVTGKETERVAGNKRKRDEDDGVV